MLRLIRREGLIEAYECRPVGRMIQAGLRIELKTARHAVRPLPPVRFLIFAQGRTGSTLLTSTLNSHPEITCKDEILNLPVAFPIRFTENVARASETPVFGFHVKIYQLTSWQRCKDVHAWLTAIQERGWKIVYLRRENLLRHVVSNVFAEATGAYHHRLGEVTKRPDRITLPLDRLQQGIERRRRNIASERTALEGLDHLEIVYERDLQTPEAQANTFARIQSYLGVDAVSLTPSLQKAVVKPLDELIDNYDEIQSALTGTPDEAFLYR